MVSNEQNIYSGGVTSVIIPIVQGELGTYPRHEPVMSLMRPRASCLTAPNQTEEALVVISGELLEVQPEKITILAGMAVRSGEMDQTRAEEAEKVAEAGISQAQDDELLAKAQAALAAVVAQPKTLGHFRS